MIFRLTLMMMMLLATMMTNGVYGPVEASDGVGLLRPLLLGNPQPHLITMESLGISLVIITRTNKFIIVL